MSTGIVICDDNQRTKAQLLSLLASTGITVLGGPIGIRPRVNIPEDFWGSIISIKEKSFQPPHKKNRRGKFKPSGRK